MLQITGSARAEDRSDEQAAETADEFTGGTAQLGDEGLKSPDKVDEQPLEQAVEGVEHDQVSVLSGRHYVRVLSVERTVVVCMKVLKDDVQHGIFVPYKV